jgi:WS/DGAT/MGAT family acyltransferase
MARDLRQLWNMTHGSPRLSGEDLSFWWLDSPKQPTTMAMLMILDRSPVPDLVCLAFERAVRAVPRLAQRVAEAPLGIALPHWENDPTCDLDFHVRRHRLSGKADMAELFREIAPVYESPFDRSRPLWEARLYDGVEGDRAAFFFKLHHAVADGVGGNAIFAAMTDWQRVPEGTAATDHAWKGTWGPPSGLVNRMIDAIEDRVSLDFERARDVAGMVVDAIEHPSKLSQVGTIMRSVMNTATFDSHSPLKHAAGRARRLSGLELPFEEVRALRRTLGGCTIDVILTIMARAMGKWYSQHRIPQVEELMTLVPVNLRPPEEWTEKVDVGNVSTGILLPLPIRRRGILELHREISKRMAEKKNDPTSKAAPALAELMSILPRQLINWLGESTFGMVDFIVTNVPGIQVPRFFAGTEIVAAYPFAPVAMQSPVSVALYGYREHLHVGITSDEAIMPDIGRFQNDIIAAFEELKTSASRKRPRRSRAAT